MNELSESRRRFLKAAGLTAGAVFLPSGAVAAKSVSPIQSNDSPALSSETGPPDYTLHIKTSPIEIGVNRIISATTYNGRFPGPLLRFKEGQQVTVDVYNDTDAPEQLHWHGQMVPVDVDGAAEEGTPLIPAHGKRRMVFTPRRDFVSITRTIERERICTPVSTAARLAPSTSNRSMSQAAMTARSSSC